MSPFVWYMYDIHIHIKVFRWRFYVYVSYRVERIRKSTGPEQWLIPTRFPDTFCGDRLNWRNIRWPHRSRVWYWGSMPHRYNHRLPQRHWFTSLCKVLCVATACQSYGKPHSCCSVLNVWEGQQQARLQWLSSLFDVSHTSDTLSQAKAIITEYVQKEAYQVEVLFLQKGDVSPKSSSLRKLNPILDENGLLGISGQLQHAPLEMEEKHPLIIPSSSYVATLLVNHYHERVKHQSRGFTEASIRRGGIWIVGAKKCISSNLCKCVKCNRLCGKTAEQKSSHLITSSNVGLDVFSSWNISTRCTRGAAANSKRWAVLFTCLSVRAVHIELIFNGHIKLCQCCTLLLCCAWLLKGDPLWLWYKL